jgi:hypothetical protein
MTFTAIEQKTIALNAVMGMVNERVNDAKFCLAGERMANANPLPRIWETLRQCAILLRDFPSPVTGKSRGPIELGLPKPPQGNKATDDTTLLYLAQTCETPLIWMDLDFLTMPIHEFTERLEVSAFVPYV